MKFVKCDMSEIGITYKRTKNLTILDEFRKSGLECARLEEWDYKDACCGAGSLNKAIKHFKMPGIRAFSRNGQIYLVKEKPEC